jgi:lipopolysaccharide/colanic/teichoic acid biosynthesis glycosyltransferase
MSPDAATSDHVWQSTTRNDPRLLRVGAFMRRWNLDELPQFWNVLKGEMSLVGPRPERTYHSEKLKEVIPHYNSRYMAKPGVTGWAQVNGFRGDTDLFERIKCDLFYLENWSFLLDFQIMLLTFFRNKNAC